jgi:hypothetical protein
VTTVVASLVILNPIGLIIASTLNARGNFMWQYFATVAAAVAACGRDRADECIRANLSPVGASPPQRATGC